MGSTSHWGLKKRGGQNEAGAGYETRDTPTMVESPGRKQAEILPHKKVRKMQPPQQDAEERVGKGIGGSGGTRNLFQNRAFPSSPL